MIAVDTNLIIMTSGMKLLLLCLVGFIAHTYQTGAPEPYSKDDPRCKDWNSDMDTRDFNLVAIDLFAYGCYEADIQAEDGLFVGSFINKCTMEPACPVMTTLKKVEGSDEVAVAGGPDNLQGLFDKFASVVANINCCLNHKIDLPFPTPEKSIEMTDCFIFPRHFPAGFDKGRYIVEINQTCADALGDGYDGRVEVIIELVDK